MGMIPDRLHSPTVGLIPTMPLTEDGHMIDPPVSVPIVSADRLAEPAAPEPELDPHGLRSRAYGLRHCPPRALQPLVARSPRKYAHSLMLSLARMIAPASRNRCAMNESCGGIDPSSASDPAVVVIRSCVSMLSFSATGMPCSGPRGPLARRSSSSRSAISSASGLVSMTERSSGPCPSSASMRSR